MIGAVEVDTITAYCIQSAVAGSRKGRPGNDMGAKLRHIAISVPDVAAAQTFFEQAFGMSKAGDAGRGVYMTDGVMNVALLDFEDAPVPGLETGADPFYGLYHIGMWVEDLEEAQQQVEDAGATFVRGRRPDEPNRYYEVKYRTPDGVVFDITTSGWVGAVRDPGSDADR